MKTIHIIIILVLVVAIAVVVSTLSDASTYADFSSAAAKPGKEFHIIGVLNKNKPVEFDALKDPNSFAFYMIDEKGIEKRVVYNKAKPQDFEKSEKVVIIGSMEGNEFRANSLLLKCPSKYESGKPDEFSNKEF